MFEIGRLTRLDLGYQGESDTRVIKIDVSAWLERFPEATIVIQVLRPDGKKYLRSSKPVDGVMTWVIDKDEVSVPGYGMAQIAAINLDTGEHYRSRVVETIIKESLQEFLEDLEDGDPMNSWVNVILNAADEVKSMLDYGEDDSGNLVYIGQNGRLVPLELGAGLEIVDGMIHVTVGNENVTFVEQADGTIWVKGVTFVEQNDGTILWSGATFTEQADGSYLIS